MPGKDAWDVITLKDGDEVVGAGACTDDDELVLISTDASLLHFSASQVRPQGRAAGGMAGLRLGDGEQPAVDQLIVAQEIHQSPPSGLPAISPSRGEIGCSVRLRQSPTQKNERHY